MYVPELNDSRRKEKARNDLRMMDRYQPLSTQRFTIAKPHFRPTMFIT
jgi:hypothetical protein